MYRIFTNSTYIVTCRGGFPWVLGIAVLAGVAFGAYKAVESQSEDKDTKSDKKPKVSLWGKK